MRQRSEATGSSCERPLAELVTLPDFRHGIGAFVGVFDICRYLPLRLFQDLQHFRDGRVALPPRHIWSLRFRAVLDMQRDYTFMILVEKRDGIVSGGDEMSDIQIDSDPA